VPLSARQFEIVDEFGQIHRPAVSTPGGGAVPAVVPGGNSVTLSVRAVLPVGGGRLAWAPSSTRAAVSWDFNVELD
jgi:hypothetical protein